MRVGKGVGLEVALAMVEVLVGRMVRATVVVIR